jgi:Mg-chelatase subunit ChlD
MEKKHQVHNLIILDESGSMESIKKTIIQGFNEIVQTVKGIEHEFADQEHFISLVTFNGIGQKLLHFIDPVNKLDQIDDARYQPNASTPLFDAMGFGINKLRQHLANQTDYNVLVTILTDGEENASKEYSGNDIKKIVEELKLNRWTFTYIGAEHDVEKIAFSLSITNTLTFTKDAAAMQQMFESEKMARSTYSTRIRTNQATSDDFYKTEDPQK